MSSDESSTEDGREKDDVLARVSAMGMERAKNRKSGLRRVFSFRGRTNRASWWWSFFVTAALAFVVSILHLQFVLLFGIGEPIVLAIGTGFSLLAVVVLGWAQLALHVRRVHDLNMNTGVLVVPIAPVAVIYVVSLFGPASAAIMSAVDGPFLDGYWYALSLFMLFLGIKKGTDGPNNYGPDPLVRGIEHARFRDGQ